MDNYRPDAIVMFDIKIRFDTVFEHLLCSIMFLSCATDKL